MAREFRFVFSEHEKKQQKQEQKQTNKLVLWKLKGKLLVIDVALVVWSCSCCTVGCSDCYF
jgi:hypothetical protein